MKKLLCYLLGHKWSYYNFTQPVIINRGATSTYAEHGRKCLRCKFDEYRGIQDFIDKFGKQKEINK